MTEAQQNSIDVLNELYAAERQSCLLRLAEVTAFVTWASARDLERIKCMIAEGQEHEAWLAEAIERCGGGVFPASADLRTASLHYIDLPALMPRVIASEERLAACYEDASQSRQPLTPEALDVIRRIGSHHRMHLQQLREMQAGAGDAVR